MKEINNLIYTLEINYINNSDINISISIKLSDDGLQVKSVRVGNICITEETIKGRVLSGRFDNLDGYCGYKYDYKNGENLLNINPNISLNTAISLINKTKKQSDFLSTELILNSISRNDYRVITLDKGSLNIIKTISAVNEKSQNCSLQESVDLLKLDGEESFVEQYKKTVYKIDDKCIIEENQTVVDSNIKSQLNELANIISKTPQNYKELIKFKNQITKNTINNTINEGKCYE